MKKSGFIIALLLLCAFGTSSAWAFHGGRAHFGIYVGGPYWGPSYYSPYPYYYPPYYPPVVVAPPTPSVYVQQPEPVVAPPVPAAPAAAVQENFWYYCAETKGYYPYTKECRKGWQKVSPQPPGQP